MIRSRKLTKNGLVYGA